MEAVDALPHPIRVHLGPMPRMLRSIIDDVLSGEADIAVVSRSVRQDICLHEARDHGAEVVIEQAASADAESCLGQMLAEQPLAIMSVASDGQSATGIGLTRHTVMLGRRSPAVLADAIRRMAAELRDASLPSHRSPGRHAG